MEVDDGASLRCPDGTHTGRPFKPPSDREEDTAIRAAYLVAGSEAMADAGDMHSPRARYAEEGSEPDSEFDQSDRELDHPTNLEDIRVT